MSLTAYNGISIPSFMYGTAWKKEATSRLVQLAVASGFTAIDTANQLIHYQEALVGDALLNLATQGFKREALFLQTKFTSVDGQDHRTPYEANADLTTQVNQSFQSSLAHLHTDYLDSYVLHGPYSRRGLGAADWEVCSTARRAATTVTATGSLMGTPEYMNPEQLRGGEVDIRGDLYSLGIL